MLFCCLLIIFKINFFQIPSVSKSLDPDQARQNVGPDLGPNCLQRLSGDNTSRKSFTYKRRYLVGLDT